MVTALDAGLNGPGSRPGRGTVLCSWARQVTLIVSASSCDHFGRHGEWK